MITEEHVMATLARSNPVPDVDDLNLVQVGTARYLATLEQRSSEVTQQDIQPQTGSERSKSLRPWLVAAAVALVVGIGFVIFIQGGEEIPPAAELPTTTLAESAPTTLAEEVTTTVTEPPTTTVPESSFEAVEGEWVLDSTTLRFFPGGEYQILQGEAVTDHGQWRWNEFSIMLESTQSEVCPEGAVAVFDYSFEGDPNTLHIAVGEDECDDRGLGSVPTDGPQAPITYTRVTQ